MPTNPRRVDWLADLRGVEDAARPPSLGAPGAAFEGRPDGGYTEVWPGPVLLTRFPGSLDDQVIEKRAFGGATVTRTTV